MSGGSFSLDLVCACTVDDLQRQLESEWAELAVRRHVMLSERQRLVPGSARKPSLDAALPNITAARCRVLSMRWGDTSTPLSDAHLSLVAQRPNRWTSVQVVTDIFAVELFLGATSERERRLFQGSRGQEVATRRPPPRREEYRRSARTTSQLFDEAKRVAATDIDASLPGWADAADDNPATRLEILAFLLQHDCKRHQIPLFDDASATSVERMSLELERRWVRENPIHVMKIGRFDYAMEFRRVLELGEERQYTALRSADLCRWITTEFWDIFNRINGGEWICGSLVSGQPLESTCQLGQAPLLAWCPSRKPLQDLWKKCPPQRDAFPFYFELLEDHQLIENIHDKIAEMATMVRDKLGAEKLPRWNREHLPFVVSSIFKPDCDGMVNSENLRNDLKRNECVVLRYGIFASDDNCAPASKRDAPHGMRLQDVDNREASYEQLLVKRGPFVEHPIDGRQVRLVQTMSLRGDTLDSALETLKYLRKGMSGKRQRARRDDCDAPSGARVWEYSCDTAPKNAAWVPYAIQWQDRLNCAWLSGEGCDWSLESHRETFQRLLPKGVAVKNALVLSLPCPWGPTLIGFEEPPCTSGIQVKLATGSCSQMRGRRGSFAERLRRLEGMTLVLQRKRIKTLFRRVGMFVMEVADRASKRVFLVMTAANHKFAERAAAMHLRTKLRVDVDRRCTFLGEFQPDMFLRGAPLQEFWQESEHRRYPYRWFWAGGNPSDPADCFTSVDRLRILNEMINVGAQLRVAELQANDVVTRLFPLHDPDVLEHLRLHWAKPWAGIGKRWLRHPFYQDIDTVRDYFGVHIAFYFEWLGFYTKWLTAPTAIGVLIYFSKAVLQVEYFQDIMEVEREHDLYPYFALFMALWATFFLEFWKRKSRMLAYKWDVEPHSDVEHVRPQFVAVLRNKFSEDTLVAHLRSIVADPQRSNTASGAFSDASLKGDLALHDELVFYPPWKATAKRLATYPLMLAMIVGLVSLLGWVYVGGLFYDYDTVKARLVQGTVDEAQWQEQVPEEQYYVLIGVANGIAIPILNVVYKKIAVALTEWELHRTHNAFNEALALKLFMFQFVNSYASLFFIAFWSRSFHRLQFQLFFIMFVGQCTQNFVELGVPAFLSKLHLVGWSRAAASSFQGAPPTEENGACNEMMQHESMAKVYDEFALSEDYLEMTIQFGYGTMFVVANPLVPLLALLNNLIEIRVDASKLCFLTQRPQPRTALGIGFWQQILHFMAMLAVVTNFGIIGYTKLDTNHECDTRGSAGSDCEDRTLMDILLQCEADDQLVFPCRPMDSLWIAVVLEHVVVLIRFLCGTVVMSESAKPASISCDEFKERWYRFRSEDVCRQRE